MSGEAQTILETWSTPLGLDLALCLTMLVYARGWFRVHTLFRA